MELMSLIYNCIIGIIVGTIAKFVMPGKLPPGGMFGLMILGMGGAIVANYLGKMLGIYAVGDAAGWIMSVLGAGLLMMLYKAASK